NDVFFQAAPDLNGAKVAVEVQSSGAHGNVRVRARFTDPKAPPHAARFELSQSATLAGLAHVTLQGSGVDLKPWTPADPNLYRLDVTLEDAKGQVFDHWTDNVGFRTFAVRGNQLLLNGHPYWLRGANQLPYGKNPW